MLNRIQAQAVPKQIPNNIRGIAWVLLATALFAIAAAMAKVAVKDYHVLQILCFRQIVVFLSTLPSIAKSFPDSLTVSLRNILRAFVVYLADLLVFYNALLEL